MKAGWLKHGKHLRAWGCAGRAVQREMKDKEGVGWPVGTSTIIIIQLPYHPPLSMENVTFWINNLMSHSHTEGKNLFCLSHFFDECSQRIGPGLWFFPLSKLFPPTPCRKQVKLLKVAKLFVSFGTFTLREESSWLSCWALQLTVSSWLWGAPSIVCHASFVCGHS